MLDFTTADQQTKTIRLFGLDLLNATQQDAIAALLDGRRKRVAFVNADCVNITHRDATYRRALETAALLFPDGSGVALAAKMAGSRLRANLNGTDLFPLICREAAGLGLSVYLLGGLPGIAAAAADAARRLAPGIRIAGTRHGYFAESETAEVISEINASGADILMVAFGAPSQDVWLMKNAQRLAPTLAMGVGGLFDFYSGRIRRAPAALRRAGLEWTWRLAMEPRRLARRYLLGNPAFVARAARDAAAGRLVGGAVDAAAKRALDAAASGAGLLALAPLFAAAAIAIKLESSGPVFFRQTRVGRDGAPFEMLKFRSMYRDAEARRAALLASSDRDGVCFKSRSDPRITRVGRVLRRASIDELPQLLNVLRGDMSLVGPRPALPSEVAAYPAAAHGRHAVRPGITGLWQVSGRAEIGFAKMIDLDLAYARSRSFLLDLVLLALTARAVVSGRGAY